MGWVGVSLKTGQSCFFKSILLDHNLVCFFCREKMGLINNIISFSQRGLLYTQKLLWLWNHRIIKVGKYPQGHQVQPSTDCYMPSKPYSKVPHLLSFRTFPWMATPPLPWTVYSSAWPVLNHPQCNMRPFPLSYNGLPGKRVQFPPCHRELEKHLH